MPAFTTAAGVRLHYEIKGNGPPLVLHLGRGATPISDPENVMGKAASLMPHATRVRIPDREHINAFVDSQVALPHVQEFLAQHAGR